MRADDSNFMSSYMGLYSCYACSDSLCFLNRPTCKPISPQNSHLYSVDVLQVSYPKSFICIWLLMTIRVIKVQNTFISYQQGCISCSNLFSPFEQNYKLLFLLYCSSVYGCFHNSDSLFPYSDFLFQVFSSFPMSADADY